jgi:apolipoprotein N-acyltransferase
MLVAKNRLASSPFFAVLTGLLLFAAWPMSPLPFLVFIAWVPLLIIEAKSTRPYRFYFVLLLNFFIWNIATTWWIWNASPGGAAGAIIANSILMTIPWMLYRITKNKLGNFIGYTSLIVYWLTFEYIHHNWQLSWPWLTLGNVFANYTGIISWYQYTGTTGGSLWVLLVNVLIFYQFFMPKKMELLASNNNATSGRKKIKLVAFLAVLIVPIVVAQLLKMNEKTTTNTAKNNIVVVQPNIEAYTEKFTLDAGVQINKMVALSESQIDSNTRMVVWPETAVATQVWEHQINSNRYYASIFDFVKKYPKITLVTGIDSYVDHGTNNPGGFSIRHNKDANYYYEAFNTAMAIDSTIMPQLYHKTKLVPGVESLPTWLSFMGKLFESMGGMSGTLGISKEPKVFETSTYKPAPVICYESIYSEYVTEYMRKGANVITIITNDGWWGNTPGYRQHQSYARLRAIETGCWVVRSANTGISCFISPQGTVINPQPWNTAAAIKLAIPTTTATTFYVKHGDWLSRIAWVLAAIILLTTAMKVLTKRGDFKTIN